jgi:hypothetical protein
LGYIHPSLLSAKQPLQELFFLSEAEGKNRRKDFLCKSCFSSAKQKGKTTTDEAASNAGKGKNER